jgi:hypothetical protein
MWQRWLGFGLGMLLMVSLLGCNVSRWSPTEPTSDPIDTSYITIDNSVEIDVSAEIQ